MTENNKRLKGRLALITGASRGIGRAVAERYAIEGAHVILVARTTGALEEVDDIIQGHGGQATLVPADLCQLDNIDHLGAHIAERFGRLDVLVCNAAMLGGLSPLGHYAPKTWNTLFDLNVHANYRLIRTLDPLLRVSEAGRVIAVTSGAARSLRPFWGAYSASKAALEAMMITYAKEMDKTAVCVNLIDPGVVATAMRAEACPGEDASTLPLPEVLTDTFVTLAMESSRTHGEIMKAEIDRG